MIHRTVILAALLVAGYYAFRWWQKRHPAPASVAVVATGTPVISTAPVGGPPNLLYADPSRSADVLMYTGSVIPEQTAGPQDVAQTAAQATDASMQARAPMLPEDDMSAVAVILA